MLQTVETPKTLTLSPFVYEPPVLAKWLAAFYNARRSEGKASGTLDFYRKKLTPFLDFCTVRNVITLDAIDAGLLRQFILDLQSRDIEPSTVHGYFRALKAFLRWYERELDDPTFRNPIRKVAAPKVPEKLQDPVELADVEKLLHTCKAGAIDIRDKAILLVLLDTGARAAELCGLDLADVDPATGELAIQRGKGGKGRRVFLGQRARRAVRAYLKERGSMAGPFFISRHQGRMSYECLRDLLKRRAKGAGLDNIPSPHDFRRACAINLLKNGADLLTVSRLLGHSTLQVTTKYLKQTSEDLRVTHAANSPVDRANW
jgi:integrase/recombinase XerD